MKSYLDQLCDRCQSKRRVAKKWKETIETFTGKMVVVENTLIICTNKACQEEFEKNFIKEEAKQRAIKLKREASDAERKANSLLHAKKVLKKKLKK